MSGFVLQDADPSLDDIAWAASAYHSGRPLDYVASILGVKPKKAFALIKRHKEQKAFAKLAKAETVSAERDAAERAFARAQCGRSIGKREKHIIIDEEGEIIDRMETPDQQAAFDELATLIARRTRLLRRRFARHWDMIAFLRGQGMRGRTIRGIYGAETLIWTAGGGIDASI